MKQLIYSVSFEMIGTGGSTMNMPKLTARLQTLNKIMGNQYVSIGAARFAAECCLEENIPDLATCPDEAFEGVRVKLARDWPSYMAYHREEERNAQ